MGFDRIFSIRMTEDQYRKAMEKAECNGIPLSDLVRKLLSDDKDVPTLRQLRIDIDRLRKDISYLQYSLEMLMETETRFFEYLLLRIPSREIKEDELQRIRDDAHRIADDCIRKTMKKLIDYRAGENESSDPFRTSEFEKALEKAEEDVRAKEKISQKGEEA